MKTIMLTILLGFSFSLSAQVYNDYIGAGHKEGVVISSSSADSPNASTLDGSGVGLDFVNASRFLSQATLGSNLEDIRHLESIGIDAWFEEQFNLPMTSYVETMEPIDGIYYDYYIDLGEDPEEYYVNTLHFRFAWSHIAQTAPDILRHRIALALSEILVISTQSDLSLRGYGLGSYYDVLAEHSFGNYKDLLLDVSLHPMMGFYLSHFNNPKAVPAQNIEPDENYAREIMQLFSIGLYELNPDGTRQTDANGNFIPTYDNDDIQEFAKVFTGLGMTDWFEPGVQISPFFGANFFFINPTEPMTMYQSFHDTGVKNLLNGYSIPANQPGMQDIEMAVEHLFNHPNVGPFIGKQLIQRLVKSNPTPEYVERITNVFNNNGSGVRGDMKAVVEAILMDEEARDCEWINHPTNGRLKEPIQRYTQYVKAFDAETPSGWFWNQGFAFDYLMNQFPMHAPTVFNFFLPDYEPNSDFANESLVGPEFQIFNSSTSAGYFNWIYYMTVANYNNEIPNNEFNQLGIAEDYTALVNLLDLEDMETDVESIVDYLDLVLVHGNMSQETKDSIIAACDPLFVAPEFQIRLALYLTMISPDYAIMK